MNEEAPEGYSWVKIPGLGRGYIEGTPQMKQENQKLLNRLEWAVMDGPECIAAFLLQCDAINLIKYLAWLGPDRTFELRPLGDLPLNEHVKTQLAEIRSRQSRYVF